MFDALLKRLGAFRRGTAAGGAPKVQTPRRETAGPGRPPEQPWMDLQALMAIESLELRVQRLVHGISRGHHRSARRGYSAEFSEYRPYSPGDDLRHLDWRRLARTDRPFLRQYEDESDWGCLVLIDLSGSMSYGSMAHTKADYARTLAGTLGVFLHNQGDPVGLLRMARDSGDAVPLGHSSKQLAHWWGLLAAEPGGRDSGLASAFESVPLLLRRPGLVVVVSDFLSAPQTWSAPLRQVRAARHEVVFFEVLDPHETEFPFDGDTQFQDLETPRSIDVDASRARAAYLDRINAHRHDVANECEEQSVLLIPARTDTPLEPVLRQALTGIGKRRARSLAIQRGTAP
jgi:uncharacterized protein (DUF58 family)